MMKRHYLFAAILFGAGFFCACSDSDNGDDVQPGNTEEVVPGTNHHILVAYFSEPLPDGVDASTSASRLVVDGDVYGSVQYVATVIGDATGGDMVRIQISEPYPGNFDDLAEQADQERQNNVHPALATEIGNFDDYDVIFVGYPIWWYQMPMAMYSFFDEYDFSGKTLIPFSTHGGSGWSGTLDDIAGMEPGATMVNGFSISRNNAASSADDVRSWLREIGITGTDVE